MSNPEGGRIAFGLSGGALVEAPAVLSTCVRPWANLWNDFDCVALDRRRRILGLEPCSPLPNSAALAAQPFAPPFSLPLSLSVLHTGTHAGRNPA